MYGKVGTLQKSKTGCINCLHDACSLNPGFDCGSLEIVKPIVFLFQFVRII